MLFGIELQEKLKHMFSHSLRITERMDKFSHTLDEKFI